MVGGRRGALLPVAAGMLFLWFLAIFGGQLPFRPANAVFHGQNVPKTFASDSTHSTPYNFKQYVLQHGKDAISLEFINGHESKAADDIVEEYSEESEEEAIAKLHPDQRAMLMAIRNGEKVEVKCKQESRDGNIFTVCEDVFPIDKKKYNKKTKQIGPFPVPRFPFRAKCSATNPPNAPLSKLTITIGFMTDSAEGVACNSGLDICYASAFEGSTKKEMWELLEVTNIPGNKVAEKCSKNDNIQGIKWHGFRIYRKVEEENINEQIGKVAVTKRLFLTDSMEFSFSKRKIKLKNGEFIHQLILTEKGIEVLTSRRIIYINDKGNTYDPMETSKNFGKRNDLVNVDLTSAQRMYYEINYNASLWTVPFDMAILEPGKYNVSTDGVPNGKNLKISAMKIVYSDKECKIHPKFDIDNIVMKWKKVASVAFNFTMLNGTQMIFYFIKFGKIKYEKSVFYEDNIETLETEIANEVRKWGFDKILHTFYIREIGYKQISNEEYANGVMVLKVNVFNSEFIYGMAKYDPTIASGNIEPEFDWTNDFDNFLNGCKHTTINLLSNLEDKVQTRQSLGKAPPKYYDVDFFVGLNTNVSGFGLTKMEGEIFYKFHSFIQQKEFDGRKILDDERLYKVFKALKLNVKFRELKEDFMKQIIGDLPISWETIVGEFGLFQEIYECPNFRVNLPQVSGKIKFTFEDHQGKINTDFIGYSSKNTKINFIESYEIKTDLGKLECTLEHVSIQGHEWYKSVGDCSM